MKALRLAVPHGVSLPFAPHKIRAGKPLYEAALTYAQEAHRRRCMPQTSSINDRAADAAAHQCQRLLRLLDLTKE